MLSASFPAAALFVVPAHAQETVTIDAPTTVAVANAKINTLVPAEPDLKVTVTSTGQITGPGTVAVAPVAAGNGDGAISFTNAGKLGAVDAAGVVTDFVGLSMTGAGAGKAGNTAALSNSGLITNGVSVGNYGGAVAVTNSGKIYGGVSASGFGAVTVDTAKGSSVSSGSIFASSNTTTTSATSGGITTTKTVSGGAATVTSLGDVVSVDGATKGNVQASTVGTAATVTVDGVAGAVTAATTPSFTTVSQAALPPAADKTVTTGESSTTRNTGSVATVTIGTNGRVSSVTAGGNDSATVTVGGTVDGSVLASWYTASNTTSKTTVTQNAAGVTTGQSFASSATTSGGDSKVTIQEGATVGSAAANGQKSAAVDVAGAVKGGVSASTATGAPNTTSSSVQTYNDKGVIQSDTFRSTSTPSGGTAAVTVASTGRVDGGTTATGAGGASVAVAGVVKGSATATSLGIAQEGTTVTNYDATGAFANTTSTTTNRAVGNQASVAVAKGGTVLGGVSANGDGGARVTNAGNIGEDSTPTFANAQSSRTIAQSSTSGSTFASDATGFTSTSTSRTVSGVVGSTASVTNDAGALISGSVTVNGTAGGSVSNAGVVRGTTSLNSGGFTNTGTTDSSFKSTTVAGPPAITTTVSKSSDSSSSVASGNSVTGTYSGVNGALNFGTVNGSIFQSAHKDSTATVSGTVYGGVQSIAGNATNFSSSNSSEITEALNAAGTGTRSGSGTSAGSSTTAAGTSTVTVSGLLAGGTAGSPDIYSQGSTASVVTVSGKVDGFTQSIATGIAASTNDTTVTAAQTVTAGVRVTDTFASTQNAKTTVTGGSAKLDVTGTGLATTGAFVSGVSEAAATVAAGAKIGTTANNGSLTVQTGGTDTTSSTTQSYARDTKTGVVTAQQVDTFSSAPSAASGNASATVAGTVFGTTTVNAARGNATATINGVSEDGVNVAAQGIASTSTTTTNYAGKAAVGSGATDFGTLVSGIAIADQTTNSSSTWVGGKATATISTSADLVSKGTVGVAGNVNAQGVGGASVAVAAGSKVNGSLFAGSVYGNNVSSTRTTTNATTGVQTLNSTSTNTLVGGTASVTNAGTVTGSATASSVTLAEVTNTGKLGTVGGTAVVADALNSVTSTVFTDNDSTNVNPATRTTVNTATTSAVGGTATVTNAAGAVIQGNVFVSGKTGTVTNSGTIVGTTVLGEGVADYTVTTTKVASGTTTAVASPATRFVQTYTANQNGLSGGFAVVGATVANPDPAATTPLQTSTVNATINLNSGSTTLGDITGQQSATGARLTNTTVNLNGSGFLGADVLQLTPASALQAGRTPLLTGLTTDQLAYLSYSTASGAVTGYAGGNTAVRVLGVETVNKTGTGTFVIVGRAYLPSTGAGVLPTWTMDVGNFNITGGEVQLAVVPSGTNNQFGVQGNITNSASLVLGRRVPATLRVIGDSLVGDGERIAGITLRQTGNFTQAASGTTVVGITPSLVRFAPVSVSTGGGASEPLGPVNSGVNIPYFTTAANAGVAPANSRVDVTGNLNLAGNVLVNVSRDSLFVNNEGYTLFTYTGTGAVTATANSTLASPFVKFSLVHDTAAKTVRVQAARTSYTTGATNPNAVAAAAALDSALPGIVTAITTDAAGGAGYTSVSQIGRAQDLANIASALDFRLTGAQIAQVFNEISSAEIYGSLSAVNQNAVWGDTVNQLATRRGVGEELGSQLWISPVGNFGEFGGTESGASEIKADTYGAAGGFDFAYLPDGVVGIGGAYAEHKVNAQGTPENAQGRTWTVGAYVTQGFGNFYANASIAYGFTTFNVTRTLALLARTPGATFDANQFDGMLELGYDFDLGGAVVTPFAKAGFRAQSFDAFTEVNGGGVGVAVAKHEHTTFLPTIGFKVTGVLGDPEGVSARPFLKASYTFQDDIGSDRTMTLLGGGNAFTLNGVNPDGYGTIEAGIDGSLGRVRLFAGGGYSFGGDNSVVAARAGLGFRF